MRRNLSAVPRAQGTFVRDGTQWEYHVARNFCRSLFLRIGDFSVLRELIFAIRTDWFFLLGRSFCDFQKVPSTQHYWIFSFLLSTCNRNTLISRENDLRKRIPHTCSSFSLDWFSNNRPVFRCFWQVVFEQTRFLSTVFLCSEFKLENIYSGINFCGKNVCGNFYLQEHIFADRWKNDKNRKN